MDDLLFLSNELQNPKVYKSMRLPLEFITFGFIDGKMYKHFRSKSTFIVPSNTLGKWGNIVVYGGLFLCKDFDYYQRILDAYHACSLSTLRYNHNLDIHHRKKIDVTPIRFKTLNDLSHLKYTESEPIKAQAYLGNLNHTKIKKRLGNTISYRIIDGIDAKHFKQLFKEVASDRHKSGKP